MGRFGLDWTGLSQDRDQWRALVNVKVVLSSMKLVSQLRLKSFNHVTEMVINTMSSWIQRE
jgi:hypothetical protein